MEILAPSPLDTGDDLAGEELLDDGGLYPSSPDASTVRDAVSADGRAAATWEVIAWAQPAVVRAADRFWEIVKQRMDIPNAELDAETIMWLVINRAAELKALASTYLGSDGSNRSSIVLYSAPTPGTRVSCFVTQGGRLIPWRQLPSIASTWREARNDAFGGWLSTGDARLETARSVNALVSGLGGSRVRRVMVLPAPHHGSARNSAPALWRAFPNAKLVTAHATGLTRHHPHDDVRTDVEQAGGLLFTVADEDDDFVLHCGVPALDLEASPRIS